MALKDWPRHRLVLLWVAFLVAAVLLMLTGALLDASGAESASVLAFFLASVCIAAPLILTWHRKRDR